MSRRLRNSTFEFVFSSRDSMHRECVAAVHGYDRVLEKTASVRCGNANDPNEQTLFTHTIYPELYGTDCTISRDVMGRAIGAYFVGFPIFQQIFRMPNSSGRQARKRGRSLIDTSGHHGAAPSLFCFPVRQARRCLLARPAAFEDVVKLA
jgi:hypothetical protein